MVIVTLVGLLAASPATEKPMEPSKVSALKAELVSTHGEAERARVDRGIDQIAKLWRPADGDLAAFAREQFLAQGPELDAAARRFEENLEVIDGHNTELTRELRAPTELDLGPQLKVDRLFAAYDPTAHLLEDFFGNKLAFAVLLNFPLTRLEERLEKGGSWSRDDWARVRLAGRFSRRVPGEVLAEIARANVAADQYVAEYNVWMHHLVNESGERLFPQGLRLISHWNLRDELKASYADARALEKQRTIVKVMERIVTQTIPRAAIDNPRVDWNPVTNAVRAAPAATVEPNAPARTAAPDDRRENDVRYERILANFQAMRRADPYSPVAPTAIARAFAGAELPEPRVVGLLEELLESPLVPKVAAEIERRLGRKLEPQDLWYNGFTPRSAIAEAELDAKCRQRYPTKEAFAKDIPRILKHLGFDDARAKFLAEHIAVDPSRGAGHAMGAARRGDLPRLRTRVEKGGMNYKGYNIAVHELGHNVEQVLSLYQVDHTLLAGVPNTAFTEAIAFVFQARDLELLGLSRPDAKSERERVLHDFWQSWEIAGVALLDIRVWHWMYEHPNAKPADLREATLKMARELWNRYYAKVLGQKDSPLLGIYSHAISNPLYLFNYPLGHLISFQIEEQLRKAGRVGPEIERMATFGQVTPDLWMVHATGGPVGASALLGATTQALER